MANQLLCKMFYKKWFHIALLGLIALPLNLFAFSQTVAKKSPDSLNEAMSKIGSVMAELYPIVLSKDKFNSGTYDKKVTADVDTLIDLFGQAKPHFDHKSPTFQVSYNIMAKHLGEIRRQLSNDNRRYSRAMLTELGAICTSCHVQDTKLRTLFSGNDRGSFATDFEYAEYNYFTRSYKEALKYYDNYLKNKKIRHDEQHIIEALKKVLIIYIQINNQPAKAKSHLTSYLNLKGLTPYSEKIVHEWIAGLDLLESNIVEDKQLNFEKLEKYVHKYLGSSEDMSQKIAISSKREKVFHVWLRGRIYHYLNNKVKSNEVPILLYWLSKNDRAINYGFYFSLADLYLKECMLQYGNHSYAKKCYAEYAAYIKYSYSGSRGTDIPDDIKQELEDLRLRLHL